MFPKLIFLKGAIRTSSEYRNLILNQEGKNGNELYEFLSGFGMPLYRDQLICFGEGPADIFDLIIMNNLDDYAIITTNNADNVNSDVITEFFTDNIKPTV